MANKKVLILSLGRGNEKDKDFKYAKASEQEKEKHLRQNIVNKESAYQTANYVFENETEAESNVFIATSLLKKEKPDIVFIVGTPGSSWTSFYVNHKKIEDEDLFSKVKSFFGKNDSSIDKQYELLRPVWDVEESNNSDAKSCEPLIQSVIEELKDDFGVEKIKAIVLPTGKNEEELEWTYSHLNEMIKSELNDDCTYDVAFDITHSFRSIPFYNYAILNYLKQVTEVKLNINKIYYGAFEAKYRLEDGKLVTPIVELDKVTNIMNLTNAVSSFNETGSVKGLINLLEKLDNKNDDMIDILSKLEWAIESNNGDAVYDGFVNMVKFINENSSQEVNEYTDILNALKNALSIPYYGGKSLFDIKETNNPIEYSNNQLVLAKWYLSKHRYSQALCVSCENFRSYLACLYGNDTVEYIKDENYRRNALDNFKRLINNGEYFDNIGFYKQLVNSYDIVYDLRNTSAHNLKNGKIDVNNNDVNYLKDIDNYYVLLEKFASMMNNATTYDYLKDRCLNNKKRSGGNNKEGDTKYLYLYKNANEKKINKIKTRYSKNVYILPYELHEIIKKDNSVENKEIFKIGKYIDSVFDTKHLHVLIDKDVYKQIKMCLYQMVNYLGINTVNSISPNYSVDKPEIPKFIFKYCDEDYENYDYVYPSTDLKLIDEYKQVSKKPVIKNIPNEPMVAESLESKDILPPIQKENPLKKEKPVLPICENKNRTKTNLRFEIQTLDDMDINEIIGKLESPRESFISKLDIIKNETPSIVFSKITTNIPSGELKGVIIEILTKLNMHDKTIFDFSSEILPMDYTKLLKKVTDNNGNIKYQIKVNKYLMNGSNAKLRQFLYSISLYWLIVQEINNDDMDDEKVNGFITEYIRLLKK